MKKGGLTINIHLTNRWLYTFIAIGILAAIGVGVYAATYSPSGAGHPYTEISTCGANQILKMNSAGNAWICASDDVGSISTNPLYVEGAITSPEGTLRDDGGGWLRTYGQTGWYSQTYGGGWYMTDTSWLRAYNSKSIYTPGQIRGDAGLCIGTDCRTSWPVTGITTETDPTVQSWAKTNNPTITGSVSVVGTANLSRLIIQKTVLYTIHTYGYAVINSCNELCDINRGPDVAPESHMCLYAWIFEYATNAWQYTTCADTISRQKRCLCLGTLNF